MGRGGGKWIGAAMARSWSQHQRLRRGEADRIALLHLAASLDLAVGREGRVIRVQNSGHPRMARGTESHPRSEQRASARGAREVTIEPVLLP